MIGYGPWDASRGTMRVFIDRGGTLSGFVFNATTACTTAMHEASWSDREQSGGGPGLW